MARLQVRRIAVLVFLLVLWGGSSRTIRADPTPIPSSMYPAGDPEARVDVLIRLVGASAVEFKLRLKEQPNSNNQSFDSQVRGYEAIELRQQGELLAELSDEGIPVQVQRRYSYLLNGLAVTIRRGDLEMIAALPSVASVEVDPRLRVSLSESVPLIGATQVWTTVDSAGTPVTGSGVKIAIIDTGIDYTHQDLGGCFGAGCKVAFGYDVVNNDPDPMDDHGHGTHCAGIAAANGAAKGVAPGATLYAYKAMDENGWGSGSSLIAGLERATNPDGDPATDDGADVISMSVGQASGSPSDTISLAVDAAVRQGAVVVAAVGNEGGSGYWTIGAPGTSRLAISVGASTKSDELFSLSSRGPIADWWTLIKPDILAPGASISSTVPASGPLSSASRYLRLSGDSMAVPHVAGCAALIKQLHPSWSPEIIKANLMNTAKDVGLGAYVQGAGRVQVDQAASAPLLITPASIGFGLVDSQVPHWTAAVKITLTNLSTVTVHYALSVTGTLPGGVSLGFAPAAVDLGPGEAIKSTVAITVDNSVLSLSTSNPYFLDARISAVPQDSTAGPSLGVPFSFCKTSYLEISHWGAIRMLVHDGTRQWLQNQQWPSIPVTLLLPVGVYDVIATSYLARRWVVREGVTVTGSTRLTLPLDEADHRVTMNPLDSDGHSVASTSWGITQRVTHLASGIGLDFAPWNQGLYSVLLSDMSDRYAWECRLDTEWKDDWFEFNYRLVGVDTDSVFSNDPSGLSHVKYVFHAAPGTPGLLARVWSPNPSISDPVSGSLVKQAYYMPFASDSRLPHFRVSTHNLETDDWVHISPELGFTPGGEILGWIPQSNEPLLRTEGLEVHLGQSPPHWFAAFTNSGTRIGVKPAIKNASWFLYQSSDRLISGPHPYQVYQGSTQVAQGSLYYTGGPWQEIPIQYMNLPAPGAYSFTVSSDPYWVGEHTGSGRVLAEFDTRRTDKDPPTMLTLNVLYNGETTSIVPLSTACDVRFRVQDPSGLSQVSLLYRLDGNWVSLPLTNSGDEYSARFPGSPVGGYVSLRIVAQDIAGNSLAYEAVPAFEVFAAGMATPTPTQVPARLPLPLTTDTGRDSLPAIVQADNGRLWVVWGSDRLGQGDLWYMTSDDAGSTWSPEVRLTTDPGSDSQPDVTRVASGTLWLVWTANRPVAHIWYRTSDDDGATWSPDAQLTTGPSYEHYPMVYQTADSRLWLFFYSGHSGNDDLWYRTSSDGGAHWSSDAQVTTNALVDWAPAFCEANDGRLWLLWGAYRSGSYTVYGKSSADGGLTWTAESQFVTTAHDEYVPSLVRNRDGTLWAMWTTFSTGRGDLWYRTSNNNGATWSADTRWTFHAARDIEQDLWPLSDGRVAVVWESERAGNRDIWFGIIGQREDVGDRTPTPTPTPTLTPTPTATPAMSPTPTATPTAALGYRVVLQEGSNGYHGSEDTTLDQWAPDKNDCEADLIQVGYHQQFASLIRFDVGSIPADARITQARLELFAEAWDGTKVGVDAYYITRTVSLCQATWNRASAGLSWSSPGCNDPNRDRRSTPEDSFLTDGNYRWYGLDLTSVVQGWVNGSLANHGVLLRASAYPYRGPFQFASTENGAASQRPRLVITYWTPHSQVTTDPGEEIDPALVQAKDGRLLAFWTSAMTGDRDVWYKSSSDRGRTWSQTARLASNPADDIAPAAFRDSDDRLWVVWNSRRSDQPGIWYSISGDDGYWSAGRYLGSAPPYARPAISQSSDGKVWVTWLGGFFRTSSDGGESWSAEGQLSTSYGHPAMLQTADGSLWVIYAQESSCACRSTTLWARTSSDSGATWSSPRELTPGSWKSEDDYPTMAQSTNGTLYLFWQRDQFYDACGPEVLYQTSVDGGISWSSPQQWISRVGGLPGPRLAALDDGAVAVVWASRQVGHDIWFGIPGQTEGSRLPPFVCCLYAFGPFVKFPTEPTRICATVYDAESVSLAWTVDGQVQPDLLFQPGATWEDCPASCGGNYYVDLGPFSAGTTIGYQLRIDGTTWPTVLEPPTPISFTVTGPETPTPTVTCTATPTATATHSPTPTASATPTRTPTSTITASPTTTPSPSPTESPTPTATATASGTPTPTATDTPASRRLYLPIVRLN